MYSINIFGRFHMNYFSEERALLPKRVFFVNVMQLYHLIYDILSIKEVLRNPTSFEEFSVKVNLPFT